MRAQRHRRRSALATALVAGAIGLLGATDATAGQDRCDGRHWVGVWSASPSDADGQASRSLAGMTSRTVLTPLRAGGTARVRLSNALSSEPTTIARASIARSASGAAVRPASTKRLRFDGRRSVTIPAGGQVVSDPVGMKVEAFRRLSVSLYVDPASDGIVTEHNLGRQTSFVATGDHTSASAADPFEETTRSRYVVSGLDVRAPRRVGAVATFGDSITDGFQGDAVPVVESPIGIDQDVRYPDFLAHRLAKRDRPVSVLNAGISGNRILSDGLVPRMGPSGLSRLGRDVLRLPGVRTVIVLEGINDIGQMPATADEVIAGLTRLVRRFEAGGLRVLLGTLTPAGGTVIPTYGSAAADAIRQEVNDWIRSQSLSDGIVDFDAALRAPSDPSRMLPAFDSSDHLHPNGAGYRAMANAVRLGALRAAGCRWTPDDRGA